MKELNLSKLKNADELAQMIELYRNDKITKFALEKELISSYLDVAYPLKITFCISEDHIGPSGNTFGLVSIPKVSTTSSILEICVDKEAVKNAFTPQEIVKLILVETLNAQKTMKTYSKFVLEHTGGPVSLAQAAELFLDIYKDSMEKFFEYIPEVLKDKNLPKLERIEEVMDMLEDPSQKSEEIVEKITVEGLLPRKAIDAAKELVNSFKETLRKEDIVDTSNPDVLSINPFTKHVRTFVDGTYQIPGKKIAHDYKPDTNQ
jgi:hypothetical protein